MADLDKEAQDFFGTEPMPVPPPSAPADLGAEADRFFTDTAAVEADADSMRKEVLNRGEPLDEASAVRHAVHIAPGYYAMPRPLRALMTVSPIIQDELTKFRRRAANVIERTGGALAYWASRPQEATTWRGLEELHKRFPGGAEAFERLAATLPEPGDEHDREVPSQALHDQLDDVMGATMETTNWLDQEPQYMEKMSEDINAEKLHVVANFDGDWNAYQAHLSGLPWQQRLGYRMEFLTKDLLAPDPMFFIDKPLKVLGLVPKGIKLIDQAIAARKIGEPLKDVLGAVKTIEAVHGPAGELVQHVAKLESKLEGMAEIAGSAEHQRVHKRLLEAKAELESRKTDAAEPAMRLYRAPRRHPQTIYTPLHDMPVEELATRQGIADNLASSQDVEDAVRKEGFAGIADAAGAMDDTFNALVRGNATKAQTDRLAAFQRLPEAVRQHLDALGVSRDRVMHAAAVMRGDAIDIARASELSRPEIAATRAFMGADDVEEAGAGLAHLRDGGSPAHLQRHAVEAPEHSVVGQGHTEPVDGIFLHDLPDYRKTNENGIRSMSRRDALTHLLGRQSIPGLAVGSTHADAPSLVKAVNKVGKQLAFGASRFMPLSTSTFVPEVAQVYDKASTNYRLLVNESQEFLASALKSSGLVEETKMKTLKPLKGAKGQLDNVIDMLDTGPGATLDAMLAKAPEHQVQLHNALRSWFDAQATRLGLDKGGAISGYFPHLFPEMDRRISQRALEFLGVNRKAFVSFWAMKHRSGAEGWSRELINTLDLYNRGATRKAVMEPAYQRMVELADGYRAAGKASEANYTERFLADARGMTRSVFDWTADHLDVPEGVRNSVETVTREATALFYKSLLGGNINYALQNMAGGTTNMAAQHGAFNVMQGLLQFSTAEGRKLAEGSGVMREALHSIQGMPQNASKALEDAYKVMDVGQRTEYLLRGVAVNTALSEQVQRSGKTWAQIREAGLDQAFIREAARATDRSQHVFGPLGRSPYLHSLLGHTGYQSTVQLGSYPWKQSEFLLKGMAENPGFIVRYLAYSGMAARMAAESFGVAAGPSVGFGFAESAINPRKGRVVQYAPGPELLASTVDLWQAWKSGDPREMKIKKEAFWRAAEAGAVGLNQLERYSRNLRESLAGRKEKFSERAPLGEVLGQLRTGNVEVQNAERDLEGTGERILHALGVQTVQDRIERVERDYKRKHKFDKQRQRMEAKQQRSAALKEYEDAIDAYTEALQKGDAMLAHQIYARESEKGRMNFSADPAQAGREAAFMRARLRMLRKAPGFMPPGKFLESQ